MEYRKFPGQSKINPLKRKNAMIEINFPLTQLMLNQLIAAYAAHTLGNDYLTSAQ